MLDRILYTAYAGDKREKKKYYVCEDALLNRVIVEGNNEKTVIKQSLVQNPNFIQKINEKVTGVEHDIEWMINVMAFFEGSEGLKLWSDIIYVTIEYKQWKMWNGWWKDYKLLND